MYFSRSHRTIAPRLAAALISPALMLFAFTASASADYNPCSTGTTTWIAGGSGNWDTSTNWDHGQPSSTCNAAISSAVTVTLSTTTQHFGSDNGTGVNGLTLSNGATLVVEGEASDNQGDWYNITDLGIGNGGLSIGHGSTLDLEATGNSATTPNPGNAPGGGAYVIMATGSSVPFVNDGTINATTTDPTYGDYLQFGANLANVGTINASSGTLNLDGTSPLLVDNTGAVNVAAGATITMLAGDGSAFTNNGTYSNQGSTTLSGSMHFIQSGGSESGNPIEMTGGEVLVDSAGTGNFEVIDGCGGGSVTGMIPQGQTVTVQGTTQNCSGNQGQQSAMTLGTGPNPAPVANHGTIVLNASGTGNTSGGSAQILGAELDNYGTLDATVSDPSFSTTLSDPLVNESGGTVNVSGGKLYQTAGTPTNNNGTVNVGPGANWIVQGGSFTNAGTLAMGISGATDYGSFTMTAAGTFNAGGTLAPTLSGYTPTKGTEFPLFVMAGGPFKGTFASVGGGFAADYSKETASNPYAGVIYGGAASTAPGKQPKVSKIAGGTGRFSVKLSCAKGESCVKLTIVGTAKKQIVATGAGTAKPGKTGTVTIKLNATGRALLKRHGKLKVAVTIKSGATTIKTATVTVSKGAGKKKR